MGEYDMPSGRAHAAMSTGAAVGLYWFGGQWGLTEPATLALAGGAALGIVVTPDLDVDQPVHSHSVVLRKFGPLLAFIWRMIWLPYGLAIRHRSWVSHMPLVGTAIRVVYLAGMGGLVWYILSFSYAPPFHPEDLVPSLPFALSGLAVSDTFHWASDILWSKFKRGAKRAF